MVSNHVWDKPLIIMAGIRSTELGGMVGKIKPSESQSIRKICSEIIYREDVDLVQAQDAQRLFQQTLEDPVELENFVSSAQRAAVIYINRALRSLTAETEALLQPHLVHFVQWLRERLTLAAKGSLRCQDGKDSWLNMDNVADESFLHGFEDSCEDARLLSAIGNNLHGILDGSVSPLDVMMQNDMLTKTYAKAHGVVTGVHMIKDWFDLKGHKQPDMKIMEVGAGTGSITLPVLQILQPQADMTPRFGSYVFTDISPGFFEAAGELLKDWKGLVDFKRLDIEKCPLEQGFDPESFDVVVASNVSNSFAAKSVLTNCKSRSYMQPKTL